MKNIKTWIKETFKEIIWVFEGNKFFSILMIFLFFFLVAILFKSSNKNKIKKVEENIKTDSIKLIITDEKIKEIKSNSSDSVWRDSVLRANGIKRKRLR